MRQGQHKSRSRNRGRRPSGSLNRVYESNGPDVKVRGTAQTVADKYLQLARDAQSGGDIVKAESYFQHAEHYLRIVAANQPASQPSQPQRRSPYDDDSFDDADETGGDEAQRAQPSGGEGESKPEGEAAEAAPAPTPEQPAEPQPAAQQGDTGEGGDGWDGHQPDFLRRGSASANGAETPPKSSRSRRERRPRTPQPELAGSEQPQIPAPEDSANTGENT